MIKETLEEITKLGYVESSDYVLKKEYGGCSFFIRGDAASEKTFIIYHIKTDRIVYIGSLKENMRVYCSKINKSG